MWTITSEFHLQICKLSSLVRVTDLSLGEIHSQWDFTCLVKFMHVNLYGFFFPMKCQIWFAIAHLLLPLLAGCLITLRERESDFFAAIWEINKCFHRLLFFSLRRVAQAEEVMRSLNHTDNMTSMMTWCILWNSLNKLLCPLFLLSEYSYEHGFWYLGWVFLLSGFPEISCINTFLYDFGLN